MSDMSFRKFKSLVANLVDDREGREIVADVWAKYDVEIDLNGRKILDLGLLDMVRTLRRSRASQPVDLGRDLLSQFGLPTISKLSRADASKGKIRKKTSAMTKAEIRNKRDELAQLPRRQQIMLRQYSEYFAKINSHCEDDELAIVGLARAST